KLISRRKEHKANMQEDYQLLDDTYLQKKKKEAMNDWISQKQSKTYIHIDDSYANCNFKFKNWEKQ
ncbi:MAG: peptidylprolyl isomerase, partial [Prolixibacteraceae bacterium]|nr:peptidylprolyl isomerase [Prolixibacteraceae bacterium]